MTFLTSPSCVCCEEPGCPPLPFSDNFSSDTSADYELFNDYEITGGVLRALSDFCGLRKCLKTPTGATWVMTGQVTMVNSLGSAFGDVGYQLTLFDTARQIQLEASTDNAEYYAAWPSGSTTINVIPADGDILKVELENEGSGAFEYRYYINGNLEHTQNIGSGGDWDSEFTLSLGAVEDGEWDNVSVTSS